MIEPRFKHDCTSGCQFLGQYDDDKDYGPCDLYAHPGQHSVVIARYGDHPADDYTSSVAKNCGYVMDLDHPLQEARRMARDQGIG